MNSATQNYMNLENQKYQVLIQLTLLEISTFAIYLNYISYQGGISLNKNILKLGPRILFSLYMPRDFLGTCDLWFLWCIFRGEH